MLFSELKFKVVPMDLKLSVYYGPRGFYSLWILLLTTKQNKMLNFLFIQRFENALNLTWYSQVCDLISACVYIEG